MSAVLAGERPLHDRVVALARQLPKLELHVHLEGTVTAERLAAIARRDGLDIDPRAYAPELAESSFEAFLVAFMARMHALRRPDDWAAVLDDLCVTQAAQNAIHTEAYVTLTGALRGEYAAGDVLRAMAEVAADHRRHGVDVLLVMDAPRPLGPRVCEELVRLCAADGTGLLCGIGIGGPEESVPTEAFAAAFRLAAELGLHRTAHAGEHSGPASVRAALEVLGAERVGHACRAVEDPQVVDLLVARGTYVDVCPTSNRATGAWDPSAGPHPLRALHDAGVRLTVGSDDPAVVGGTLTGEWAGLVLEHGLRPHELVALTLGSVAACFLPPVERARLRARVDADIIDLNDEAAALEEALAW
ncbi:MAG TPA: hypothetical protein VI316_09375 [Candidatus Dormibacteraeota bacterium]